MWLVLGHKSVEKNTNQIFSIFHTRHVGDFKENIRELEIKSKVHLSTVKIIAISFIWCHALK